MSGDPISDRLARAVERLLSARGISAAEDLRAARLIIVSILAALVQAAFIFRDAVVARSAATVVGGVLLAAPAVAAIALVRTGRLSRGTWISALGVIASSTWTILMQGAASPRIGFLLPALLYLAFAVRPWMGIFGGAWFAAVVLLEQGAERAGWSLPLSPSAQAPVFYSLRAIFLVTVMMASFSDGYRRMYQLLRRRANEAEAAHAELLRAHQRLEALVTLRSAALLEASRELETFRSGVSHDLRAPLRHMESFLALCLRGSASSAPTSDEMSARLRDAIADIRAIGERAEGILDL